MQYGKWKNGTKTSEKNLTAVESGSENYGERWFYACSNRFSFSAHTARENSPLRLCLYDHLE